MGKGKGMVKRPFIPGIEAIAVEGLRYLAPSTGYLKLEMTIGHI